MLEMREQHGGSEKMQFCHQAGIKGLESAERVISG